ncbi:ASCH domain-containing protein [Agrilactobacillus fermenti]|uniref:ASCH domain-containing protein n=1 Tax=Agrilactobacillus fermenti TaxID=2586909 RepID=UPI001E5B2951|nr:ASCH domain-containing protein [Agrilactobacillus fermenti]MCD2257231.1 ASCH domain-containing protein [Agrilactobacillus fermenti]
MQRNRIEQFWDNYRQINPQAPEQFQAWAFGSGAKMADELADLVLAGKKTATASNYLLYELTNEPLPQVGDLSIVLNGSQLPVCVIRTTKVYVTPFKDVTAEHAAKEGEGDRSLAYWRSAHEKFFAEELATVDQQFTDNMMVVCEEFEVVYS